MASDLRTADILQSLQNRFSVQHDHVEDIHKQVGKITQLLGKPLKTHIGSNGVIEPIPHKPIVFHGREASVEKVAGILCNEAKPRVCILGSGGMGKTALAAAVIESEDVQDKFKLRFWVPCIQATSTALFLELLYRYLRITRSSGNVLDDIVYELNASSDPRLVLLDNFETLWYNSEPTRREIRNILPEICKIPHVALLVTMRGNRPPCHEYITWLNHELGPVDKDASRRIYHELNPDNCHDPNVDGLLAAVGHLPFAITLMANRGAQSRSSAEFLLEEWSRLGTNMISDGVEGNLNRSIGLSVDSHYVRRNPDALTLLATLALLPAGTSVQHLRWWAPEVAQISLARVTLTGAGLLDDKTPQILSTLPVVQSFMVSTGRIPNSVRKRVLEGCCDYVLGHACRWYDLSYRERSEALAMEDANIQSILLASHPTVSSDDRFVEALLAFGFYCLDTRPNLEIAYHCLEFAKSSNKDCYVAEATLALGRTHWRLGNFREAELHLPLAYQHLYNVTSMNNHVQMLIVECCWDLVQTRRHLEWPATDLLAFGRQFRDRIGNVTEDAYLQANVLRVLGFCHMCLSEDLELAMDNLLQSATAFQQVKDLDCRSDLADVLQLLAKLHHTSSRLPEALDAIEEATNAIPSSDNRMRGVIGRTHGEILISLGQFDKALSKLEESLLLSQQVGHLFGTAWTLEHFGFIYASRGHYEDAIMAYEAAANTYSQTNTETSPMSKRGIKRCQDNLIRIEEKKKSTEKTDIHLLRYISVD